MSILHQASRPEVSIVIPVHNRVDQLKRLLDSVGGLTYPHSCVTVIICDDGSTERLHHVIQSAREIHGVNILHLQQDQGGPGAARNLGLRSANSEYIAFTDSDCEVSTAWLDGLITSFNDPDVGIVGGAVLPHPDSPLVPQCSNWIMSSPWGGGARDPRSFASMNYYPRAGNMAVRTSLALTCGGFPETRYGEDIGFSQCVVNTGARSVFSETAVVYHNEMRSLRQIFVEAYFKGHARTRLWRSLGAMEVIHAVPALLVLYLLILPFLVVVWRQSAVYVSIPAIAYGFILLLIGCQSVGRIRRFAALIVAPCCALLMHVGYGLGQLLALKPSRKSANNPVQVPVTISDPE